ncbi:hypothetical protein [Actinospica robiniae]|uniref:hypothetical protein n=1 Tax=Actinospica robiniae TaxID=304901 RepID=UPI000429B20B|nr:hypothetical protein [Actinospica robiniae]
MPKTNAEKLGIRPASTLEVVNAPDGPSPIGDLPADVVVTAAATAGTAIGAAADGTAAVEASATATADVIVLFAADSAQLRRTAPAVLSRAAQGTKVWIAYRKGGASDLVRDSLMPAFTDLGWHGVSLISLDGTWSAARFRRIEDIGR